MSIVLNNFLILSRSISFAGRFLAISCCLIVIISDLRSPTNSRATPNTFYVAPNGDDNNPGTVEQPWEHISFAAMSNAVSPGDTVFIRGGIYNETIVQSVSGIAGKFVTFKNYPGEMPIITDNGASNDWRWLILDQSYVRVEGLTFSDYEGGAIQIRTINADMSNIEIVNNVFQNQQPRNGTPFKAVHATTFTSGRLLSDILIQGNSFLNIDTGTELGQSDETLVASGNVQNVKIIANSLSDVTNIGIDIVGRPTTGQPENVLIKYNQVANHGSPGQNAAGIYLDGAGKNIIIERNTVHGGYLGIKTSLEPAASSLETEQVIIRKNVIYNNEINLNLGVGGVSSNCNLAGKLKNSVAVHNTVYSNTADATNNLLTCGENLRWKNNIFAYEGSDEGFQHLLTDNATIPFSTWTLDYNHFYSSGGAKYYRWAGTRYESLSDFKAASSQEQNAAEGDPQFLDITKKLFLLKNESPIQNSGGPLAITTNSDTGKIIPVNDARYFTDGFGVQDGDLIRVGSNSVVKVVDVDYVNNEITVDRSLSWQNGDPVNYQYFESGPAVGAYEFGYQVFLPKVCAR